MPRLFVDCSLTSNQQMTLPLAQSHYLLQVLRMKAGEDLLLFNGQDGEWAAQIEVVSSKKATLQVKTQTRLQPEADFPISLFFAPLKAHRLEMILEKATEIGVTELIPCLSDRTQVRRLNPTRLEAITREAAEQSNGLTVPFIAPLASLQEQISRKSATQVIFFCDLQASDAYFSDQLAQYQDRINEKKAVGVVVGPEGGWSAQDRALLSPFPNVIPVRLGKTVLRAETACFVALALLQDWIRKRQ